MECGVVVCKSQIVEELFETPHDRPPEHAFMITVYLDESEHSDTSKYTVVAGFRGKKRQWDSFLPAWEKAKRAKKQLHLTSLRWNSRDAEKRIRPLLERLGPIPYEHGLIPVFGAVKTEDYFDLIRHDRGLKIFGGYMLSLSHVLTLLLETVPAYERIKIVCENQETYSKHAMDVFRGFAETAERDRGYPKLSSIEFVSKKDMPMFEAADYLAFAIGKTFSEPGSKKDLWCRPIQAEGRTFPCRTGMWLNREVARETIRQIQRERKH
jgi:hypothetical protein